MAVVRWFRFLLSLPFIWLGQAVMLFQSPLAIPLLKTAWRVGGDGRIAVQALALIQKRSSRDAARDQAAAWMASYPPQKEIVIFAGLLALDADDLTIAEELFALAEKLGPDRDGLLEFFQIMLVRSHDDWDASIDLAKSLETRTDLSPLAKKTTREMLLLDAVLENRSEETFQRANYLWNIENNPMAAMAFWVLEERAGRQSSFDALAKNIRLTPAFRLYYICIGCVALNMEDEALRLLEALIPMDVNLAKRVAFHLERKREIVA